MMSGLIPGPKQPRKDIDTYFMPLVEDLKECRSVMSTSVGTLVLKSFYL
jgi:hypothetical protein